MLFEGPSPASCNCFNPWCFDAWSMRGTLDLGAGDMNPRDSCEFCMGCALVMFNIIVKVNA